MKRIVLSLLLAVIAVTAFAQSGDITVTVVSSEPVTGLTSIDYEFTGIADSNYDLTVEVNFDDGVGYQPIPKADLSGHYPRVSGVGTAFSGNIMWNGAASFPDLYHEQTRIKIMATLSDFQCGDNVTFTYRDSKVTYGTIESGGLCWMDRNLGASEVATSSTDAASYGDLFQWGRLDDGHQDRASTVTSTLSTTDVPGHGEFITPAIDWRSEQNDNLWQGVNGINNPCPTGWRVPTEAEWAAELANWGEQNSSGAFASPLKLPMAGYRDRSSGSLFVVGSYGYYWSSTVDDENSRPLFFRSGDASMLSSDRAFGNSVRCVKELD